VCVLKLFDALGAHFRSLDINDLERCEPREVP